MANPTTRRRVSKKKPAFNFDKYALYKKAVQSPDTDAIFFRKVYRDLKGKNPQTLREDFSGAFAICCEWVKLSKTNKAIAVDFDPEPLDYGILHYRKHLSADQKRRLKIENRNVLKPGLPKADIVCVLNFSYFVFKRREILKKYFQNVYKSLKPKGVFILDCFGGQACLDANEDETKVGNFTYYWDQQNFDPVTGRAQFYIHFKLKGKPKEERVFSYDWRMWNIPEIREILEEVGFKKSSVYWEGTNRSGGGNGVFTRTEKGEACESWIAYIAAEK